MFIFLGLGIFAFDHPYEKMGPGMFFVTLLIVNFTRFLNISFISFCVNRSRSEESKISKKF